MGRSGAGHKLGVAAGVGRGCTPLLQQESPGCCGTHPPGPATAKGQEIWGGSVGLKEEMQPPIGGVTLQDSWELGWSVSRDDRVARVFTSPAACLGSIARTTEFPEPMQGVTKELKPNRPHKKRKLQFLCDFLSRARNEAQRHSRAFSTTPPDVAPKEGTAISSQIPLPGQLRALGGAGAALGFSYREDELDTEKTGQMTTIVTQP